MSHPDLSDSQKYADRDNGTDEASTFQAKDCRGCSCMDNFVSYIDGHFSFGTRMHLPIVHIGESYRSKDLVAAERAEPF